MKPLSLWSFSTRSFRYFFRSHSVLAFGIAAATAVIVGALVVGDSVRGSLGKLVLDRLANVECLLHSRVFFNPKILADLETQEGDSRIIPGLVFSSSTVEKLTDTGVTRGSKVQVLALDSGFWDAITFSGDVTPLEEDQAAINDSLARELGVAVGDEITVRMNTLTGVSGDNPLGSREDDSTSIPRQKVVSILPDESFAGISFLSSQSAARNVFLSLATLQDVLEIENRVNAGIVLRKADKELFGGQQWCDELNLQIRPGLEDYALTLEQHRRIFPDPKIDSPPVKGLPPAVIHDYYQLSSDELVIDDETSTAVITKLGREKAFATITYLANSIAKVEPRPSDLAINKSALAYEAINPGGFLGAIESSNRPSLSPLGMAPPTGSALPTENGDAELLSRKVPYSIIVGAWRKGDLNLEKYAQIKLEDRQAMHCWINSWLAEQIDAQPGDWLEIRYFEPETVDGKEVELSENLMIAGIVPLTEPARSFTNRRAAAYEEAPTAFNDPGLTPYVPGVTDQESISNWDVPFKLENDIDPVDDVYWRNHRLTPKIFMPYQIASSPNRFGSRFGRVTAIQFPASKVESEAELRKQIEEALLATRRAKGIYFQPIRERLLSSASGTTPFDMLFLSLSFFVIVAALILVSLLFKLGIQRRSNELGLLAAQGYTPARIRGLLLRELCIVSVIGAFLGIALGLGYAKLMVVGLESWWIGAIASRFLTFFASPQSLTIGAFAGFAACMLAIFAGLRTASKQSPLKMLRSELSDSLEETSGHKKLMLAIAGLALLAAIGLVLAAFNQTGMARAGSFFGSGMLLLFSALIAIWYLIATGTRWGGSGETGGLVQLAWLAICRNPMRSTLSLGLLSVATFLIASMSVFQIAPTAKGFGGFDLLGVSSSPIYRNIGSRSVREDALSEQDARLLQQTSIVSMRARFGEDASCNNLFQATQPTILGVPERMRELHDFAPNSVEFEWAATIDASNPWNPLNEAATGQRNNPIPVILDQNTAAWSLKQGASIGSEIHLELSDKDIYFRTVGLLANSVLQGKLLIDQDNFENIFPEIGGYSFFMVNSGNAEDPADIVATLEKGWSLEGLDLISSRQTLENYLAVQNTYISAFQSLGALGLLLGTFGLAAVQIRSVLEREKEFALMRAVGFAPQRISTILTLETAMLLGGGLLTGVTCAAIALVPYAIQQGPNFSLLSPIVMLAAVTSAGMIAAILAVRTANRRSVLDGLRA